MPTPERLPARDPSVHNLVPASMADAMELAKMMAASTLVPKDFQAKPANCLLVIMQSVRWQMDPFAVIQETSIIQSRPMYSGKLVAAVINARGHLQQRLHYEYSGQGDNRTITVTGWLANETLTRQVTVDLKKVRTKNEQWDKQPDQMLMYHAARVWARRHTPELMLGVYSEEEFDPEPQSPRRTQKVISTTIEPLPPHDPDTGEVDAEADAEVEAEMASPDLKMWGAVLKEAGEDGLEALQDAWERTPPNLKKPLEAAKNRYKQQAASATAKS